MFTLPRLHSYDQEIKKSRFRALACPIASEDDVKALLMEHSDASANHNCWAWRLGQTYRFNDDGEPSGTAGKPILQAIDGQQIDGVLVIVTRWFGGVLLGSGGLIRAYGGTAAQCLREAEKVEVIHRTTRVFRVGFSDLALVKARLSNIANALVNAESFTETGADLTCAIPENDAETVAQMLIDITAGRVQLLKDNHEV
ncbi:putative YigZ family protein [Agrobacterium vitis]|nr:putative YigZ family protein [Agrobacterium vitis]MBE1438844.1 putative YigZ family protein [Agrobacterium vitis]